TGKPNTSSVAKGRRTILNHGICYRKIPIAESIPVNTATNTIGSADVDVCAVLNCEIVEPYIENIAVTAGIQYCRGIDPSIDYEYFVISTDINIGGRCRCTHTRHTPRH